MVASGGHVPLLPPLGSGTGLFSVFLLGQNKMSAYCVYDLKSCRSYMIRLIIKGR